MSKSTSHELLKIQQALIKRGVSIFTPLTLMRLFKLTQNQKNVLLSEGVKNDVFTRIKKGLYSLNVFPPSAFELANVIYTPSYISLDTALSYYRIIPEVAYSISSLTTKSTRNFDRQNRSFLYSKINSQLFFGYSNIVIGNKKVLIAEKEKALLDYFYFIAVGLKKVNDRFDFSKVDKDKVRNHLPYFQKVMRGRKLKAFDNLIEKFI